MNTLHQTTWQSNFGSKQHYIDFKKKWSEIVNSDKKHTLTSSDFVLYALLRGRDWRKGFTLPVEHKGNYESRNPFNVFGSIRKAFRNLEQDTVRNKIIELFDGLLTMDMIDKAISYSNLPDNGWLKLGWKDAYTENPHKIRKIVTVEYTSNTGKKLHYNKYYEFNPWEISIDAEVMTHG